jgi:type I restriction enzyme S subunit
VTRDYLVTKGQILMAMTGATIGKAGIFDSDEVAYLNQLQQEYIYSFLNLLIHQLGYHQF